MSEPAGSRGTKAGRNEQRKIAATFLNNAAVGLFLAALLQPGLAFVQATRTVGLDEGFASLTLALVSLGLFMAARTFAGRLED